MGAVVNNVVHHIIDGWVCSQPVSSFQGTSISKLFPKKTLGVYWLLYIYFSILSTTCVVELTSIGL